MAGYTRQSTFTDGDIINAADSNDEFNQLVNTFSNTTGHKHNGTAGEGPVIGLIGDPGVTTPINKVVVDDTNNRVGFYVDVSSISTEQIRVQDGAIVPVTDDDVDLGASGAEFKDLYIDGTANIDSLVVGASTAVTSVDTDLTSVSASDDTLASAKAIKSYVDAQVTAQDLDFQADTGGALNIDLDTETLTLTGGTGIDTTGSGNTVTFDIDSTVATLSGTQTLTNKTIDAASNTVSNIDTTHLATGVLDTDLSTVSASDDTIPSAKATKAYVDAQVTAADLDFQADTGGALSIDLDSETMTFTGGTGIDTAGSLNDVTFSIDSTVATLTGTQTLTNKTLTSAVLNGTISGTSIKDEDTMVSDSASHLATQQSIKAYVDAQVGGAGTLNNVVEDTTPQLGGNLDVNGQSIVSASGGNIAITPDTTGSVIIDGLTHPQADGSANQSLVTNGTGTLSFASRLANVVEDTTPQLGGNLDVQASSITTSTVNGGITLTPNGTGNVTLGTMVFDADQTIGAGQDNYVLTYDNTAGTISLEAAAAGGISNVVDDTTPQLGGELDSNGNSIQMADGDTIIFGTDDDATVSFDNTALAVEFKYGANDRISYSSTGAVLHDVNGTRVLEAAFGKVEVAGNLELENRGEVQFYESSAAGSDYMAFKAPNGLTTTTTFTLPDGDGTSGQALVTNGTGTLSWATPAGDGDGLVYAIALG
jgi:hypothetical protein